MNKTQQWAIPTQWTIKQNERENTINKKKKQWTRKTMNKNTHDQEKNNDQAKTMTKKKRWSIHHTEHRKQRAVKKMNKKTLDKKQKQWTRTKNNVQ